MLSIDLVPDMNGIEHRIWLLAVTLSLALTVGVECVNYRLDRRVLPIFYNLTIDLPANTNQPGPTFTGDVKITLQAVQANVTKITLHKEDIVVTSAVGLYNEAGTLLETIQNSSVSYDQVTHKLTVPLTRSLTVNVNYTLHLKYMGKVHSDMRGLYAASYVEEHSGNTKWMVLTQLQRIYARLLFPCFDEPAFKAKFQLHIGRRNDVKAISNTKLIETTKLGNTGSMDHFAITPPMSTYLVAFIVSEYQARGNLSETAVVTRPQDYNYSEFSYNVSKRVLDAYDKLFQHPYKELGIEILLHANSPRFPHNGMENWGLIIYSDPVLVHKPHYTDGWHNKEMSVRIISHETSHMWFGDSVTFAWWNNFWLNEAFARYYEYFVGHQLYPEYQLDQQFVVRQQQQIFMVDSMNSTQPLSSPEREIQSPSQIGHKFSSVTYAKGASVIRMWRNIMGDENFDRAIQTYLRQHHLGNTEPKDLFEHLKENWTGDVDLDQFFFDFTEQVGFPTVIVESPQNDTISLRQQRFILDPEDGSDISLRYTVPITFATNLSPDFENLIPYLYFDKKHSSELIRFAKPIDWIVLNLKQSNYYRVYYEQILLDRIREALIKPGHSDIPPENRAALIDDLFNFALIGMINYTDVFNFLEYLSTELDYVPWYATYVGLQKVAKRFPLAQLHNFNAFLHDITRAVFTKLGVGWSPADQVLDVYNRKEQVAWLCKYQHVDCNENVLKKFRDSPQPPSPDYRETFYCAVSRAGGYAHIMEYYRNESNPAERELLWRTASCTRDYRTHYHDEILVGPAKTVSQKMVGLEQLYVQNPDLITAIFRTIIWDIGKLADALESWKTTAEVLSEMADYFTTWEQRQLFFVFYDHYKQLFGNSAPILRQALDNVDENLEWAAKHLDGLVVYLTDRNGAAEVKFLSTLLMLPIILNFVIR